MRRSIRPVGPLQPAGASRVRVTVVSGPSTSRARTSSWSRAEYRSRTGVAPPVRRWGARMGGKRGEPAPPATGRTGGGPSARPRPPAGGGGRAAVARRKEAGPGGRAPGGGAVGVEAGEEGGDRGPPAAEEDGGAPGGPPPARGRGGAQGKVPADGATQLQLVTRAEVV